MNNESYPAVAEQPFLDIAGASPSWRTDLTPGEAGDQDEYDVVVIGSGMGGLGCAALLSKWGYRVLVLEHHYQVGGYYGSFQRSGFRFNTGAMEVTGLWPGGPFDRFLRALDLRKEDYFSLNSYRYGLGDWRIEAFDSLEQVTSQLAQLFPSEAAGLTAFFDDAEQAHREWFLDADVYGSPPPPELLAQILGADSVRADARRRPRYYDWLSKSWGRKLDEHFRGRDVKAMLNFLVNHMPLEPGQTPAEVVLRDIAFLLYGSSYPKGGAQKLSDDLRDLIRDNNGEVLLRHRVDRIEVAGDAVAGVWVGDDLYASQVVVSNSCIRNTVLDLLDPGAVDPGYLSLVRGIEMQEAYGMAFLGVDRDLRGLPSMIRIQDEDSGLFSMITINSNADASYAPEGQASVTIFGAADYAECPPRGTRAYKGYKDLMAAELICQGELAIPGLGQCIVVQDAATPRTLERYTLAPQGSGEGVFWSMDVPRPWFKTPVRGLYLAGSSTYPGAGLELAVMSGINCANDIDGWRERWR
jgi:all-trans-retinol 13,14-reductase